MRKVLFFAAFLFLGLLPVGKAHAADLTVTCPGGNNLCTISPSGTPLFNQSGWVPGSSATEHITVVNNGEDACNLTLSVARGASSTVGFDTQLLSKIERVGGGNVFDSTFDDLFNQSPISLGTVSVLDTNEYTWEATFDHAATGYQSSNLTFDFDLHFSCGVATPTPIPAVLGRTFSAASAPVCSDATPSSAPSLSIAQEEINTARLNWTAVSPVSHYMIRYGTSSGSYIYGASNVGDVNTYLVRELSSTATFYFQVAGVNGCAPGPWSNEVSIRPTGHELPIVPAPGFVEGTLGAKTESSPSPSGKPAGTIPTGEVEGASTCSDPYIFWWLPLLAQLVITGIYYLIIRDRKGLRLWWIFPLIFAGISQLLHMIIGCNCTSGELCKFYWVFNLIILAATWIFYQALKADEVSLPADASQKAEKKKSV
jgi:hypothetical protein